MDDVAWKKKFDAEVAMTVDANMQEMRDMGFDSSWAYWEWKLNNMQFCYSWRHSFWYGWDLDGIHGVHCNKCLKRVNK